MADVKNEEGMFTRAIELKLSLRRYTIKLTIEVYFRYWERLSQINPGHPNLYLRKKIPVLLQLRNRYSAKRPMGFPG